MKEVFIRLSADSFCHLVDSSRIDARRGDEPDKVRKVASPTAKIGSTLIFRVIGHIKTAKHMSKVSFIAIGERKLIDVAQSRGVRIIRLVLQCDIACKRCVLWTTERSPC